MLTQLISMIQNLDPTTRSRLMRLIQEANASGNMKTFLADKFAKMFAEETWHLEFLGIARGAAKSDVESSFRALQKVVHPDCGGNERLFRLAQKARERALKEAL